MIVSKKGELWNKLGGTNPNYLEIWETAQKTLLLELFEKGSYTTEKYINVINEKLHELD